MIRDTLLVLGGFGMGWAFDNVRPVLARSMRGWAKWFGKPAKGQWFSRSDAASVTPTLPPRPQPTFRPVRGQRPSEGAHRAKVSQARFATRTFRRRQ